MKAKAQEKKVDLLLIDSGDLHDGNGLTDGFPEGSVDAHDANKYVDIAVVSGESTLIYVLDLSPNFHTT